MPVADLLRLTTDEQLDTFLKHAFKDGEANRGEVFAELVGVAALPGGPMLKTAGIAFRHLMKQRKHQKRLNPVLQHIYDFVISRPVISLSEKERGLFRGAAALAAERLYTPEQWNKHLVMMAWNEGKESTLNPTADVLHHPRMTEIRDLLVRFLRLAVQNHDAFLAEAAAELATLANRSTTAAGLVRAALSDGARWMTAAELGSSPFYNMQQSPSALLLGYDNDTKTPVFFSGHESLITIGGPGSGKSQAQVITNLLLSRGSAIVLDVKGELWHSTAGYRSRKFGPVYKFSPTDALGLTHRYNPFDFISTQPDQAAIDCGIFSFQVIAENPKLTDPYWESKGRDFLWAFAMLVALHMTGKERTVESLAKLVSLPLDPAPNSDIRKVALAMQKLGADTNIPDLQAAANALTSGLGGNALNSVIDTARRYMSPFARSNPMRDALACSDWKPDSLRARPGSTIYIAMSPAELKTYAPIVRLLLMQHARILQRHAAKPTDLPITFFLDEMPQLGNFDSILEVQDVGRGAGLRLWMFAQSLGQLSQAFGPDRYEGVVDACRVRCFMQPDTEAAKDFIAPALGEVRNLFNGERRPLATAADLMGRAFHDKTIITTRGDMPMALARRFAFQTMAQGFLPPPVLKPRTPGIGRP